MKRNIFLVLLLMPSVLLAQLDKDGKTELTTNRIKQTDRGTHSILFSGSTLTPFGVKYQYCKNFGGYISFRTDAGLIDWDLTISAGISKSTGKYSFFWFGGGFDLGDREYWEHDGWWGKDPGYEIETGWLFIGETGFSFDIGLGSAINIYYSYDQSWSNGGVGYRARPFLILGLGYSF